ncbi:Uncharacterised protein [Segatella copri]|nr:Uncharacterised protein [Segatella copri]
MTRAFTSFPLASGDVSMCEINPMVGVFFLVLLFRVA